jgi:hypothetical protein
MTSNPQREIVFGYTAMWQLAAVDAWLDEKAGVAYQGEPGQLPQDWARVAKVCEEIGEAFEEISKLSDATPSDYARLSSVAQKAGNAVGLVIGMTGQNPRKGVSNTEEDLLKELADCWCAAMFAIQHFTKDSMRTEKILQQSLTKAYMRTTGAENVVKPNEA